MTAAKTDDGKKNLGDVSDFTVEKKLETIEEEKS